MFSREPGDGVTASDYGALGFMAGTAPVSPILPGTLALAHRQNAGIPPIVCNIGPVRKHPPPFLSVEASTSQSPLLCKLSFNPHSNLELGPYYLGFTTEGAILEVRGRPWVPLPRLLLQIMGFYLLHSQNYWTLGGHLREVEAAVPCSL